MLLVFDVHFLADAVNAHNTTRHAGPGWKFLAILASLSTIRLVHSCRRYPARNESGITCGPFGGHAVLIVAELEEVPVAGMAVGVSSSGRGECTRSIVSRIPDVPGVRGVCMSLSGR